MKYKETEVKELTNKQLIDAEFNLVEMEKKREDAKQHPNFSKKHPNGLPEPNPVFVQLKNEVSAEIKSRGL